MSEFNGFKGVHKGSKEKAVYMRDTLKAKREQNGIDQYHVRNKQTGEIYKSIYVAAKHNGLTASQIRRACRGETQLFQDRFEYFTGDVPKIMTYKSKKAYRHIESGEVYLKLKDAVIKHGSNESYICQLAAKGKGWEVATVQVPDKEKYAYIYK